MTTLSGMEKSSSPMMVSNTQGSEKSSNTTVSQEPLTTLSSSGRALSPWQKQRREHTTSRLVEHLTQLGSVLLTPGLHSVTDRVDVLCANCKTPKTAVVSKLLDSSHVWCKRCAGKSAQQGRTPDLDLLRQARAARKPSFKLRLNIPEAEYVQLTRWASAAKNRCTNPKCPDWENYGGRGIEFRFGRNVEAIEWIWTNLGPRPEGMTIDRIDSDGHYEPGNLRYASLTTQARNQRRVQAAGYAERLGRLLTLRPDYHREGIRKLIKAGLTDEEILAREKGSRLPPQRTTSSTAAQDTDS